jgi:hypothetical protein
MMIPIDIKQEKKSSLRLTIVCQRRCTWHHQIRIEFGERMPLVLQKFISSVVYC